MAGITLLCVGRLKEACWTAACDEYLKRLRAAFSVDVVEVRQERLPERPSKAEIERAIAAEGSGLLARIPDGACIVALCVEGRQMDSPSFSAFLRERMTGGTSHFAFIIGGPHGLAKEVKRRAQLRLSFSPMTFPHQLARVMLLEQLYRACTISEGRPYHK